MYHRSTRLVSRTKAAGLWGSGEPFPSEEPGYSFSGDGCRNSSMTIYGEAGVRTLGKPLPLSQAICCWAVVSEPFDPYSALSRDVVGLYLELGFNPAHLAEMLLGCIPAVLRQEQGEAGPLGDVGDDRLINGA